MTGAGTGAGVATVMGVRRNERRKREREVRRVKCDIVRLFQRCPSKRPLMQGEG